LVEHALASTAGVMNAERVSLIAAGKAAPGMASAAVRILGDRLRGGVVVAPWASTDLGRLEFIAGGHPIPSAGSERGGRRALEIARATDPGDALLVLISGGASALMAVPAEGLVLGDKQRTTDTLLRAGADIHALNTVRKHLSGIKGGQLAAAARAPSWALAISDVVGDDPSVIASGPTVADRSTFEDAHAIIRQFGGLESYPSAVVTRLEHGRAGSIPDTPKPGDPRLAHAETRVIGSRAEAMRGAAGEARRRGYHVHVIEQPVVGFARDAAASHLRAVGEVAASAPRPLCVVSSGETTVRVTGSGRGGRNQEFALAAAQSIETLRGVLVASVGTDGIDGPTDAAGAVVDSETLARAERKGLAASRFLDDNNSYVFFESLGDLIRSGPTGTNVGDLQIVLFA
jgi:glycerate 2-kinase